MPQRVIYLWTIVLGLLGLAIVGILLILRKDLSAEAQTGPQWKRRLVGAALLLLASGGAFSGFQLYSDQVRQETGPNLTTVGRLPATPLGSQPLADTPHWRRIAETWRDAEDVASGLRGSYPFTQTEKDALLLAIEDRAGDVKALAAVGLLEPAEVGLLSNGLKELARKVNEFRSTEERSATCYVPMPQYFEQQASATYLADQVALLEKLTESRWISTAVIARILSVIELDLDRIERSDYLKSLQERRKRAAASQADDYEKQDLARPPNATAEETVARTRKAVERIRSRLSGVVKVITSWPDDWLPESGQGDQ